MAFGIGSLTGIISISIYLSIYLPIYLSIYLSIYQSIYNQIVHHNPCFNLFILHNSFDNQGSEINDIVEGIKIRNKIHLRYDDETTFLISKKSKAVKSTNKKLKTENG